MIRAYDPYASRATIPPVRPPETSGDRMVMDRTSADLADLETAVDLDGWIDHDRDRWQHALGASLAMAGL